MNYYIFPYGLDTYLTFCLSTSSNTLMKLAKGSTRRIESFEKAAHRQLQTSSSKLSIRDDIVSECMYICNQNFYHRMDFHCVAISDDNWMLWNFDDKKTVTWKFQTKSQNFLKCIMFGWTHCAINNSWSVIVFCMKGKVHHMIHE